MDVNPGPGGYNPDFPPQYPHQRPSWFGRNWFWFVPLTLFLLASPFLCCGGCGLFAYSFLKAPLDACIEELNQNAIVSDRLGVPIKKTDNTVALGNFQNNNGEGHATLGSFEVSGPKGRAKVSGRMKLRNDVWSADGITIKFDDGTEVTIPDNEAK